MMRKNLNYGQLMQKLNRKLLIIIIRTSILDFLKVKNRNTKTYYDEYRVIFNIGHITTGLMRSKKITLFVQIIRAVHISNLQIWSLGEFVIFYDITGSMCVVFCFLSLFIFNRV